MKKRFSTIVLVLVLMLPAVLSCQTQAKKAVPVKEIAVPPVTFIELGSVNCVPCKMMKPVMEQIEKEYGDSIKVVFYDVWQARDKPMATKYKVRVIPTQVFLDRDGKEFHRHEGFYPAEEIMKVVDKQLGIKRSTKQGDKDAAKAN
jgi:thioredoxin 1